MVPVDPKYPTFAQTAPEDPGPVHQLERPTEADLRRPIWDRRGDLFRFPYLPDPAPTSAFVRLSEADPSPAPTPIPPEAYLNPPPILVRTPPDPDRDPNPDRTHPSPPTAGHGGRSSDPDRDALTIRRAGSGFVIEPAGRPSWHEYGEFRAALAVLDWAHGKA